MTKLASIRTKIAILRRTRQLVRWLTAYSALATVILWALFAVFVIDFTFFKMLGTSLDVAQRFVVLLLAAGAAYLAFRIATLPLLGVRESDTQVALLVEKQHQIKSDVVAALQFESPDAGSWGSRQLENSVIDYVARIGPGLNVFEGFSKDQMIRRGTTLAGTIVVLGILAIAFADHTAAFANRLLFGSRHYPTATTIEQVIVNHNAVLLHEHDGTTPQDTQSAQGQPLVFAVQCSGDLDTKHEIWLTTAGGGPRRIVGIDLTKLTADERLERLKQASAMIRQAIDGDVLDLSGTWVEEAVSLVRFDAPVVVDLIEEAVEEESELGDANEKLKEVIEDWPGDSETRSVYVGQLERMVDPVRYSIYIGDAWTDPAEIAMIPLPVVEPRLSVIPPKYAQAGQQESPEPSARQLSVLEGSEVKVAIECTNKKPLTKAWLVAKTKGDGRRFELTKMDDDGLKWSLASANSPFARVQDEIRFEIQVTDGDGLHLQTPIQGYIRLRADRGPIGSMSVVRNVYLPTAKPVLDFTANDDYGISKILLQFTVESDENMLDDESTPKPNLQPKSRQILGGQGPILASRLPHRGKYTLDLASLEVESDDNKTTPFELKRGHILKVSLEIVDYRGEHPGESYTCEPIFLEIADLSGVIAANAKDDERADKSIEDIKNKILE